MQRGESLLSGDAGVAQSVRVPACHAGGRGFEPRHSRHPVPRNSTNAKRSSCAGVAQSVRVPACHAGGRGFEPRHSRHFFYLHCYICNQQGAVCTARFSQFRLTQPVKLFRRKVQFSLFLGVIKRYRMAQKYVTI